MRLVTQPPVAMLRGSAELVHADLLARLREAMTTRFEQHADGSPERIAGYLEDGLSLLTGYGFRLDREVELSMEHIEACRRIADQDARFRFIYRLPSSVGWGAAIGGAVESSLFGESDDAVRTVTALLNAFMTFLDGLLDEAPEVIGPYRQSLFEFIDNGLAGRAARNGSAPVHHLYASMCFVIARLWIGHFNRLRHPEGSSSFRNEFLQAVPQSIIVEYSACESRFGAERPPSMDILYGRTCWPLWTQALAAMCQHERPPHLDIAAFRDLIFCIGEYAAYLDDVRDYLSDCVAGQWNSVSLAFFLKHPFHFRCTEEVQAQLLANLADDEFAEMVVHTGLSIRDGIERQLHALHGIDTRCLLPLLDDLTYEYVD